MEILKVAFIAIIIVISLYLRFRILEYRNNYLRKKIKRNQKTTRQFKNFLSCFLELDYFDIYFKIFGFIVFLLFLIIILFI